ncbi:MAG: pimeloyl-CoA dehydrogenase small subunit [Candidatus Rokuibacteriota bacterium]|nr:MAG: pimeloyl-CoA dehydrogenase small subunit [Candidatus Rokubacteria bacterium]PYO26059.1 MAG: pimeloyl-CoA dehydrogenase small subunit [Candidatus Rokubacteria bacterium]
MNFEYSDEQRLLSDTLRKFLGTGYSFDARGKIIASPAGFSDDVWAALAEMGVLSVPFDAVYGGFGGTTIDMLIVFEAFGEALVVEPYLATVGLGGRFVARGGSAEQRARILPALIQGKHKMAFAQTEVDARWDLRRVTTRATKSGDGWVLEGDKRAVLHGGSADTLVVSARTGGAPDDARGISLFLVERTAPGVAVTDYRGLDNLRVADVRLSGVRAGRDALLGPEGDGFGLIEDVVDYATTLVCGEAVGAIKYAHDATLDYLKTRRQFGVPIGSFQALQHRMVDILISYEQARSIACLACVKIDTADAAERRRVVSAAKIKIADAARHVSQEAVQLHGGMGMTEELKISHTFRRLTMIAQAFGDADHHLARFGAAS